MLRIQAAGTAGAGSAGRSGGSRHPINISLTVSPVRDSTGKIVGASKIARDITERNRIDAERRKIEAQNAILAREAEHRTKNILTTVQATVQLTKAENIADFKSAIDGRILALSNVHNLFVESRWIGAKLHDLITQELAPYRGHDGKRVSIEGPALLLEPNLAQTIAVILHELATNAAKYGALSVKDGRIFIALSRSANGGLVISWTEAGGPTVTAPAHEGFGTRVMTAMTREANGEMRLDWRAARIVCEIILPIGDHDGQRRYRLRRRRAAIRRYWRRAKGVSSGRELG